MALVEPLLVHGGFEQGLLLEHLLLQARRAAAALACLIIDLGQLGDNVQDLLITLVGTTSMISMVYDGTAVYSIAVVV